MKARDKIERARVQLQDSHPFFGYLTLHLNPKEDKARSGGCTSIDKDGNLCYNPEAIEELSQKEVEGVLAHEILHLALGVFFRKGQRNKQLWNIAQDIVINDMVLSNGLKFPEKIKVNGQEGETLLPEYHNIEIPAEVLGKPIKIEDINEKTSEGIYSILDDIDRKQKKKQKGGKGKQDGGGKGKSGSGGGGEGQKDGEEDKSGGGSDGGGGEGQKDGEEEHEDIGKNPTGFDEHIYEGEGKEMGEEKGERARKWAKRMTKAYQHAKSKGNAPAGVEERLEEALEPKVNWKELLYRYITNEISKDYTWQRPSKKTRHLGTYLPSTTKEGLDVVVSLDTSGSVSTKELQEFMGEIISIAKTFRTVNMTVVQHDAKVQKVQEVRNGNIEELKNLEVKGRGGTDHKPVFEWIKENKPSARLLVSLTDGYTSVPDNPKRFDTVWVLNNEDIGMDRLNFGRIVRTTQRG